MAEQVNVALDNASTVEFFGPSRICAAAAEQIIFVYTCNHPFLKYLDTALQLVGF